MNDVRLIAFYLPQFHPIPENDHWWGKGFTEWTNVTKARPLFAGHYQPHLPTDLGFYDLRLRQSRRDQISLAKEYGISAFCYHYYWFSGKRLLEQPLDDMLADEGSDMPFCLCWANENWSRRWDGQEQDVLIEQKHREGDDLGFIESVRPFLEDVRYLRVDGKPLLIVYDTRNFVDLPRSIKIWRDYCRDVGIGDIYLVGALTHWVSEVQSFGFDAGVEFPPNSLKAELCNHKIGFREKFSGAIYDYSDFATNALMKIYGTKKVFRCVFPSWDNTARRGSRALAMINGTPGNYEYWLRRVFEKTREELSGGERLVFVNAWNEWAEGCHLEPDRVHGRGFLEATLRVVSGRSNVEAFPDVGVPKISRLSFLRPGELSRMRVAGLMLRRMVGAMLRPFPTLKSKAVALHERMVDHRRIGGT